MIQLGVIKHIERNHEKHLGGSIQYRPDGRKAKALINSWLIGKKFLLILDDIPSWEIVEVVNNVISRSREKTRILVTSRAIGRRSFLVILPSLKRRSLRDVIVHFIWCPAMMGHIYKGTCDDLEIWRARHLNLLEGSFSNKVVNLRDGVIEAFVDLGSFFGLEMAEAIAKGLINLEGIRKLSIGAAEVYIFLPTCLKFVERMEFLGSFTMKGSFEDEVTSFHSCCMQPRNALYWWSMMNHLLDWVGRF
ncbi:hypothetical protein H5410_054414 [Solanum commersonii]|uniref:NB-ARC domain-containing protein n=1 Tax=Solanum commersonii TaxID=4109 RepID=A0A9J5WH43_SOLCO|nr:hypothetical protein H5410_054414 [Solanum commersonii]